MIARCTGLADVIAAVRFARENRLLVAIRGGGHNVGGRAVCDGGMVIDLSGMKGIHVDPGAQRVRAQPGVLLGELDRETHVYGMTVPLGAVSKTGIAGLTLGGGVGWLARKYGLTCDNVISFELVTADGEVRRASADETSRSLLGAARRRGQLRRGHVVRISAVPRRDGARRTAGPPARPRGRSPALLSCLHAVGTGRAGGLRRPAAYARRTSGRGRRGLLQRRPRRGRTGAGAAARLRPAHGRSRSADADAGHADALRRSGPGRQPELLEVGIPACVERRGDRDDPRAHQPGELATERGAHRAVRRRRQPRRDRRHGVRAAPRAVRPRHPDPMGRSGRISRATSPGRAALPRRCGHSRAAITC